MTIISGNTYGYYSQEAWEESAIRQLEKLDIIREAEKRWDNTDYITRRDAFQIAYIVRENTRNIYHSDYRSEEDFINYELYLNNCEIKLWYPERKFVFEDLERGSDDYYLMASLFERGLATGREEDGKLYADLDESITYNETFATILRMTMLYTATEATLREKDTTETLYYDFAKEMKLFSSGTIFDETYYEYAPKVEVEQLNEPVRAYEYLYYIWRALYIPSKPLGDYAPEPVHYFISDFSEDNKVSGDDITI